MELEQKTMLTIILIASILNDHPDYFLSAGTCEGHSKDLYLDKLETVATVNELLKAGAMGN